MTDAATAAPFDLAGLDELAAQLMTRDHVPGLTVGVSQGGRRATRAWGLANVESGVEMTPDTLLQIGSISKIFTTALAMSLVDEGRLDLDVPVSSLVPGFRLGDDHATATVTVRHCLTHMGGFDGDRFDDHGRGDDALERCVAGYDTLRQQLPPGTAFSYCNTGFNVVGRVIEVITGQPFETAMRERIFDPLGLARATYFAEEAILARTAAGHEKETEASGETTVLVSRPWPLARNVNPAGGITADVDALLTFGAAFLPGAEVPAPFPSPAARAAMAEPQVPGSGDEHRGLGWLIERLDGALTIGHGGATNGFKAQLFILPEHELVVATLANGDDGVYTNRDVIRAILRETAGLDVTDPEPAGPVAGLADRVAGTFRAMLAEVTISGADDDLQASLVSINPFNDERREPVTFPLVPLSATELMVPEGVRKGTTVDLLGDGESRIDRIRVGGRIAERLS